MTVNSWKCVELLLKKSYFDGFIVHFHTCITVKTKYSVRLNFFKLAILRLSYKPNHFPDNSLLHINNFKVERTNGD